MEKTLMIIMLSVSMCGLTSVCLADPIKVDVGVEFGDPHQNLPIPRSPAKLPDVYVDGNTLSFENLWGTYVLQILQGSTVVYTTVVPYGTTSVVLPSSLSGNYEFRLVADSYYYYCYISL